MVESETHRAGDSKLDMEPPLPQLGSTDFGLESPSLEAEPGISSLPPSPGLLSRNSSFTRSDPGAEDWDPFPPVEQITLLDILDNPVLSRQLENGRTRWLRKRNEYDNNGRSLRVGAPKREIALWRNGGVVYQHLPMTNWTSTKADEIICRTTWSKMARHQGGDVAGEGLLHSRRPEYLHKWLPDWGSSRVLLLLVYSPIAVFYANTLLHLSSKRVSLFPG